HVLFFRGAHPRARPACVNRDVDVARLEFYVHSLFGALPEGGGGFPHDRENLLRGGVEVERTSPRPRDSLRVSGSILYENMPRFHLSSRTSAPYGVVFW